GRITVESVVRCSWNGWPDDRGIRNHSLKSVSVTGIPHWGQTPKAFRVSRGVRLSDLNLLPDDPVSIPGASNRVCSVLSILIHHWWGSGQALHKSGSVSKRGCGLRRPLGRMQAGVPPVRRFSQWRRCPSSAGGLPSMGAASSDVDAGAWLGLFDRGTCSRLDHGLQVA
ncbi:hypothetical protein FA106_31530, partial [Pseudomonas aeruginosa]|nr:hypothetical protein [Pseudomonas aeruginosa]